MVQAAHHAPEVSAAGMQAERKQFAHAMQASCAALAWSLWACLLSQNSSHAQQLRHFRLA